MLLMGVQLREGGSGLSLYKKYFELGVGGKARTRLDILRVVLSPFVQYCQCEASEQKMGPKEKSELKEIELSYCHHSMCLQKRAFKKNNVKIG